MADQYIIELYRIEVATGTFTKIDELSTFENLQFYTKLNSYGGCMFNLNIFDAKANKDNLRRYRTVVAIKKNKTIVWVGHIVKISGNFQGVEGVISVECLEHLAYLTARYTDQIRLFEQTDAGTISSILITETQAKTNGKLGITIGTIEATIDRDRTFEYKQIEEAIEDLTSVIGGFDFTMTPEQDANDLLTGVRYDVFVSLGSTRNDLNPLQLGFNVSSTSFVTADDLINTATFLGSGSGEDIITSFNEDASSQLSYTRRESIVSRNDISLTQTLNEKSQDFVNQNKIEKYFISISLEPNTNPGFGDFGLGDILNYDLSTEQSSILDFTGQARVEEIRVNIDENGAEIVTPKLDIII